MNTDHIKQIQQLTRDAKTIGNLRESYLAEIKQDNCDKYEMKFGGDDRFASFSCKVFLDCHTGYYGNSSCSRKGSIDASSAQMALNYALNKNMNLILQDMAEAMKKKAASLVEKAQAEIDAMTKAITEAQEASI